MRQTITLNRDMKGDYHYNEAIRALRTNIQFCGNGIRTIMLTSSLPDEGESDITFAMVASLAQIGKKVMMIDADIKKSVLVSRYQLETEVYELPQYLSGQKMLVDVLYDTNVENLNTVFAGPYSPNLAELLEEDLFEQMVQELKKTYDYMIIGTPPMANLIDGAIVARQCDDAVMVVESGCIDYRLEQRVRGQLEKNGCRILRVVLNEVSMKWNGHYSEYYSRYGKYGKYSKYGKYGKYGKYEKYEEAEA